MFPIHARYVTHRANEVLSPEIQAILWTIIDRDLANGRKLDYLQVFSLSIVHAQGKMFQRVRQRQEQPELVRVHDIPSIHEPVSGVKVWIIDSGDYCTMLLPDDY